MVGTQDQAERAVRALQAFADKFGFGAEWSHMADSGFSQKESANAGNAVLNARKELISEAYLDYADYVSDECRLSLAQSAAYYIADNQAGHAFKLARRALTPGKLTESRTHKLFEKIKTMEFRADGWAGGDS